MQEKIDWYIYNRMCYPRIEKTLKKKLEYISHSVCCMVYNHHDGVKKNKERNTMDGRPSPRSTKTADARAILKLVDNNLLYKWLYG